MTKVVGYEKDKTTNEIAFDLEKACKDYIEARRLSITVSNETVARIRVLAEELLRWRIL
jgi:hypothetical protein